MENQQHRPNLLDLPISLFEYDDQRNAFGNIPTQQTTLRRIVTTKFYRNDIEAIRVELDKNVQDKMKKKLPTFSPVAWLHHRRRDFNFDQKIRQQWPLLMGDVDKKDNPGIDMAELKTHLARLPYLLICAYSVRAGLWFIIRLPDEQTPETLTAHFRYLQKLFKDKFGIKLDTTKGGNPTDLRFVSYDPAPYINDNATVMSGKYILPPYKTSAIGHILDKGEDEPKLISQLVRFTEAASEGERHTILLKAARLAGGFVAAGRLDEHDAVHALEMVANRWPNFKKSQMTIRDGIRYGKAKPVHPDITSNRIFYPRTQLLSTKSQLQTADSTIDTLEVDRINLRAKKYDAKSFNLSSYKPPLEQEIVDKCEKLNNIPNYNRAVPPSTRVAHPRAPLAFDQVEQLRRIRWAVIPSGTDESDYNPE